MTVKKQNEAAKAAEAEYQAFVQKHYMSFMNDFQSRFPDATRQEAHLAFKKYYIHSKKMTMSGIY